jgi:predicted secreted hydrolase
LLLPLLPAAGWLASRSPVSRPSPPLATLLGAGDTRDGFAQALSPRPFEFPADHGPHAGFRHEWWYFTGNLADSLGRNFGFQLTFFRYALRAGVLPRDSAWRTHDALLAHFALAIPHQDRFVAEQRLGRPVLGVAGSSVTPTRVWVRNWHALLRDDLSSWSLRAATDTAALDLTVQTAKPLVAQGIGGISRKGPEVGNASFYYSGMRLAATGRIVLGEHDFRVDGLAWLDREWGSGALGRDVVGWDWFGLQLDDGCDLMIYRLRTNGYGSAPESAGTWSAADGKVLRLGARGFELSVMAHWRSPRTGTRYPARWQLRIRELKLALDIFPLLDQQEWEAPIRYWEGAVEMRGARGKRAVGGRGYVELTGY